MNSCILPYVKSSECALEQRQASLGKHPVWAALLPGCKYSSAIAKLGTFPFLNCSKYCPWHPNVLRYKSREYKYSLRNFSSFSHFFARHGLCWTTHLKPTVSPRVTWIPASSWPEDTGDTQLPSAMISFLWSMTYRLCFSVTSNICSQLVFPCVPSPHLCRL